MLTLMVFLIAFANGQKRESDYRLPKDIDSIEYQLTLAPDPVDLTFTGEVRFVFRPLKTTQELVLNSKDLTYGDVRIYDNKGNEVPMGTLDEDKNLERIYIKPVKPYQKEKNYVMFANYTGTIYEQGFGLYYSDYKGKNGRTERMIVSQLRPVHARRVFPCLDEPSFRAHFVIKIIHEKEQTPISNMPVKSIIKLTDALVLSEFEKTPPIPAFLVAVLVSDLPQVAGVDGFVSLATPENLEGVRYSSIIGPKLAAAMQSVTAITFPLNMTHQVALPKLVPVAMENWGLYNYRESNILYFEGVSPTVQKQTAARFSGHEICHAWMGNMVSLGWWDYLWMSEVFAMYYEYILPYMVDDCWRMEEQMVIDLHQSGLLDDSVPTNPLTTKVLTPAEISNKFSGITYTKGPGVLRMAIHILGHETYLLGFRKLLLDLAYNSVSGPEVLWGYLSRKSSDLPAELNEIMTEWTVSSGYPVLNVAVTKQNIMLSQSKFTLDRSTGDNVTWWIPLTYTTLTDCDFEKTKPKAWFRPDKKMMTLNEKVEESDWVIFNIQSTGFYRVNYDVDNWMKIIRQLYESHKKIIPLNRAQLIDDSLNLARAGKLSYNVALSLAGFLSKEIDFIPWRSAVRGFNFLITALLDSDAEQHLNTFLSDISSKAFETIGWNEKGCEDHTTKVNREEIVRFACEAGHRSCLDRSISYVQSVVEGRPQKISVDVKETAFCTGVRVGSDELWFNVKALYDSSDSLKATYLAALACKSTPSLINRFLKESIKRPDDLTREFSAFAARRLNAGILLNFLKNNQNKIEQSAGNNTFATMLTSITPFLTTEDHQKSLNEFNRIGIQGLEESMESLQKMINWREKNVPKILSFFSYSSQHSLVVTR